MTKEIILTKGYTTLVDDEDFEYLNQWKWHYFTGYAVRSESIKEFRGRKRQHIHMHRIIANTPNNLVVDHINGNSLDNRKCNLRNTTQNKNAKNQRIPKNNTLGYKGISVERKYNRWTAHIKNNGKQIHIGAYSTAEEAARAYDTKAKELFGEFANLNFPTESK